MERAFLYDENLVASCSASTFLLGALVNENIHDQKYPEQLQILNVNDQACWDLFVQHGEHFHRPIPTWLVAGKDLHQLDNDSRLLQRFQQFLISVHLVNEHNNNSPFKDSLPLSSSFRLTLNRFADVPTNELPVQQKPTRSQNNRRLSLGLQEVQDQDDGDDGAAWFHPWEDNSGDSSEIDNTPLTRLAGERDIRLALHSSWGIGHGSIGRLDPPTHHHHRSNDPNSMKKHHAEKRKDFAVPIDQSAFAQVPFPDDDVAVSKLNGKELAIKQARPSRHKSRHAPDNATQNDGDDNDDNANDGDDDDDNNNNNEENTTTQEREPPTYLNWATTENPDGVPLVHDVFDQGKCGSCWAFAATGTLETSVARRAAYLAYVDYVRNPSSRKNYPNISHEEVGGRIGNFPADAVAAAQEVERAAFSQVNLSIQQLVDCDTAVDRGCTGGNPLLAFYYIHRYGLTSWEEYPYVGYQDKCHFRWSSHPVATVKSWGILTPNHENNIELVLRTIGPVAVGFNGADPTFLAYQRGIFDHPTCGQSANHALLIVGFGQEEQENGSLVKYWIARNSWGKGWGESGFVRIKRGDGARGTRGVCGIARSPSVALGGTWLDGKNEKESFDKGFCSHLGHLGGVCDSAGSLLLGNKALFFCLLAIAFTSLGIVLPLTADCRRRRRRRKERRYNPPQREIIGRTWPETQGEQGEALPLLQGGSGGRYGGGLS